MRGFDAVDDADDGMVDRDEGGREAAMTLNPWFVPVDHAIVGIVDGVEAPEWKGGPA